MCPNVNQQCQAKGTACSFGIRTSLYWCDYYNQDKNKDSSSSQCGKTYTINPASNLDETVNKISVPLRAGEFCGVTIYNGLTEDTEYKIELTNNATIYGGSAFSNTSSSWVYDWEFDINKFTLVTSRDEKLKL